jgi:catechol 2,3-dioxygenase-like lactoylglutathione lyase family enzyme
VLAVHPVLMARDVAASAAWFARLGFATTFVDAPDDPRYAGVTRDGLELHLQWADAGQWAHDGDRPAIRLLVDDIDALYAEYAAAGVLVAPHSGGPWGTPGDTPWGTREFHLRDPGGTVLQFYRPRIP